MQNIIQYGIQNLIGAPLGLPPGLFQQPLHNPAAPAIPKPQMPGEGLKRALNYMADYGGCGFYRCMSPNLLLNLHEKAVIVESTVMILDPRFYTTVEAVKVQRQATPTQLDFIKAIKGLQTQARAQNKTLKLIYEVDDVVFDDDIPMYNRNRDAFTDPKIQQSIREIIHNMDEVTVTSEYFRDYMISKTGFKNVTSVPNYLLKWWFDRYYNLGQLVNKFERTKKKPVIGIFASGTHVDVLNRTNYQDDFAIVLPYIIKTLKDFEWRFYGSHPIPLKPYIDRGQAKYIPWTKLPNFPQSMADSEVQVAFAALQKNEFNNCKSNIKLLESGAIGLPCVCPDLPPYKDAILKYKTGEEFIDCIKHVTKNQSQYADYCKRSRAYIEDFWLDDEKNYMKHYETYFTPFGSKERKFAV